MDTEIQIPTNLRDAVIFFGDAKNAHDTMVHLRWPNGIACPRCGSVEVWFTAGRLLWQCKGCKKQFTAKVGTIFEDSPLPLTKWLPAVWLIANCKNGISSCELHRALDVTQKTAWFMLHRVREAMCNGSFEKLTGSVEADETFIGGLERNKHEGKKLNAGRGTVGKAVVAGLLERGEVKPSKVRVKLVADTPKNTLHAHVREHVAVGSPLYTDAHAGYSGLSDAYVHEVVDHAIEYVRDNVHTNGLENFWSLLKRTVRGTYVAVDVPHLTRYLDEQTFRFNNRKDDDAGRFASAIRGVEGKRLTYEQLTQE